MTIHQDKSDSGALFVVATPIGNLEDITLRALRVLREADFIAAEDTRRTVALLTHFGISKKLMSLHGDVERRRAGGIVEAVSSGKKVAIVSDAGTPGASDPGGAVVRAALDAGLRVVPIPGSSAISTALSAAGLRDARFVFEGFPTRARGKRRKEFENFKNDERALVLFESPSRVKELFEDLFTALGPRRAVVFRELTKLHETITAANLETLAAGGGDIPELGEFTIVVEGAPGEAKQIDESEIVRVVEILKKAGLAGRTAAQAAAAILGVSKNHVYGAVHPKG